MERDLGRHRFSRAVSPLRRILLSPTHGWPQRNQENGSTQIASAALPNLQEPLAAAVELRPLLAELVKQFIDALIDRAILYLPLAEDSAAREQIIRVSPAGKSWSSKQATLSQEDLAKVDTLSTTQFFAGSLGDHSELGITPIVSDWAAGLLPNNGLIVAGLEGMGKSVRLSRDLPGFRTVPLELRVWYTRRSTNR